MTNEEFLKHIGIEFKIARVRKNLSRPELAKLTNLSISAVQAVELGKSDSHILTYKRLFDALGMDMKVFL
jgi:transcriptional regulator with XRE-family HTH domain